MTGTLEDLSGKADKVEGSVVAAVGKYPKKAFDAVGLNMTEGQALLATTGLLAAGGLATAYLMSRGDKDKGEDMDTTVEVPTGLPTAESNGKGRE
ncbi:MAG: hypothetical protein ACN2B6_03785 [Rickettsiales bacterium]